MIIAYFDVAAFLAALDQVRQQRKLTWHQVWHETGIQIHNLRRTRGHRPKNLSVHTVATLVVWAGLDANTFMKRESVKETI